MLSRATASGKDGPSDKTALILSARVLASSESTPPHIVRAHLGRLRRIENIPFVRFRFFQGWDRVTTPFTRDLEIARFALRCHSMPADGNPWMEPYGGALIKRRLTQRELILK